MNRTLNPEMDRFVLDALAEKYNLTTMRTGTHLSSLNYCLTKGYLERMSPLPPTDTELLLFATGYGLEAMLTHSTAETPVYEVEGITCRPDNVLQCPISESKLVEIKSTRSGVKRYQEGSLPDTWITYTKGVCHMLGENKYNLTVIYVAERPSARIISETLTYDNDEIEDNWNWLLERRDIYEYALQNEQCPEPFTTCEMWQCNYCKYKTICDAIVMLEGKKL